MACLQMGFSTPNTVLKLQTEGKNLLSLLLIGSISQLLNEACAPPTASLAEHSWGLEARTHDLGDSALVRGSGT